MIRHCVIIGSSYTTGCRIALHYTSDGMLPIDKIQADIKYIYAKVGKGASIAPHFVSIEKSGFSDLAKYDKFFEGVKVIDDIEEFIRLLILDRKLNGLDVARYILSLVPCTHLKLQKLLYLCYADYLCKENDRLFEDNIYAYRYGPVIESVYKKYKDDNKTYDEHSSRMAFRSRIFVAEKGIEKVTSIDKTIKKYGNYTASELVNITHNTNSPWSKSGAGEIIDAKITDEIILEYHKYEEIKD